MHAGHGPHRSADVVERQVDVVHVGQIGELAALPQPDLLDIRGEQPESRLRHQPLEIDPLVVVLAGRNGRPRRALNGADRGDILRRDGILEPQQPVRLHGARQLHRRLHVVVPVTVHRQSDFDPHRMAHRADQRRRVVDLRRTEVAVVLVGLVGRRHVDVELQHSESPGGHFTRATRVGLRRKVFLLRRVPAVMLHADDAGAVGLAFLAHPLRMARNQERPDALQRIAAVAVGVDGHAVAILAAEQAPGRHAELLAENVDQGGLNPEDGVRRQPRVDVGARHAQPPHDAIDGRWVLADENRSELADDAGESRSDEGLAPSGDVLVGLHLDDRPVEVGLEYRGGDSCDAHAERSITPRFRRRPHATAGRA